MIKCINGNIGIEGEEFLVFAEFISLVRAMRVATSDKLVTNAINEAFKTPHDELHKHFGEHRGGSE